MIPNLQDYSDKKEKGLVSIQKIDAENMAIATKQFSAIDGTELPAQVFGATIAEVDKEIADKLVEVANLKAFKVDLEASK